MNAMKFTSFFFAAIFLSFLGAPIEAAYWQHDEGIYLSNYDAIINDSYAEVDTESNRNVLRNCQGGSLPTREISINSPASVYASQIPCGPNDICIVEAGVSLIMDASLIVGAMIVKGDLEWTDVTQKEDIQYVCGGYIVVEGQGTFKMHVESKRAFIYIRNNGAVHPGLRSRAFGSDARGGGNPYLEVKGRPLQRTWSLLSEPLTKGSSVLKLLHDGNRMGWRVGDRLAIAPMERHALGWGQEFVIVNLHEDGSIVVDHPSRMNYDIDFQVVSDHVGIKSPEVINLSRNIVITGDDLEHIGCDPNLPEAVIGEGTSVEGCRCDGFRSKCTVGLHTMQKGGGVQKIHNTRVEKCGQRGIEGKYCLHFHRIGECPECSFENNAIELSHQRGIIIHGTHLSRVEGNVLYNVRGAGIYIEDGNEMYNDLAYNVVICPYPFLDETFHGCTVPGTSNRLSDTKDNQSSFFVRGASNNLIGNRGVNSFNGLFLKGGGIGRGPFHGKVCESASRLGRFDGNTFHGNGRFGTYALGFNYPKITDQSIATNGINMDQSLCEGFDSNGNTRGLPGSFSSHSDYGNAFVGHYSAGDLQYKGHFSVDNNNLLYWKETKNFENGCAAHITKSYYARGTMALPDHGTFLIENTVFGDNVLLETNHHCNVGNTGVLCMPTYMLNKVSWQNTVTGRSWVQFMNDGGIFTLSPEESSIVASGGSLPDSFFPPGYVSLVSNKFNYLLDLPGDICILSQDAHGGLYHSGILCRVPLRALRVYTQGPSSQLMLQLWWNKPNGLKGQEGAPTAVQFFNFHRTGASKKQGFAVPVIPGTEHSYKISLSNGPLPSDWVIEFSDPVVGNRWSPDFLYLNVVGRDCGNNGLISSQHDRKFIWSGDEFLADEAWGNHGACVGSGNQPSDEPAVNCNNPQDNQYGSNDVVEATECPAKCGQTCDSSRSYCDCGTATCQCKAGFTGANCEIDLCEAAGCGEHGRCTARYLGASGALPVTSNKACICKPGWTGASCERPSNFPTAPMTPPPPTPQPTIAATPPPPISSDTANLVFIGNDGSPQEAFPLGLCEGDCDRDSDCSGSLKCSNPRSAGERVPGCQGEAIFGIEYCYADSSLVYLEDVGNDGSPATVFPLKFCQGDCDSDQDCEGDLVCMQRSALEPVPGCQGNGSASTDYCVRPNIFSNPPASTNYHCGCETCTDAIWNTNANGHSCGDRIEWLQSHGYAGSEGDACRRVGEEFPAVCGSFCNPDRCSSGSQPMPPPTLSPTEAPESCDGVCKGEYPFSCAENVAGAVKYGCYPGGGCFYAQRADQLYPYNNDLWCTYKLKTHSRMLRGSQGNSSV